MSPPKTAVTPQDKPSSTSAVVRRGPVPIDPGLLHLVSGGGPKGTWSQIEPAILQGPKGSW
jgi:hypothetical protein